MSWGPAPPPQGTKPFLLSQRKPGSPGSRWSLPAEPRHLWGEAVCAALNKGGFLASALRGGWCGLRSSLCRGPQTPALEATRAFLNKRCGF